MKLEQVQATSVQSLRDNIRCNHVSTIRVQAEIALAKNNGFVLHHCKVSNGILYYI